MYENQYPYENHSSGTYQTGSTQPPKSRGGLIAFLLILVILLFGAVTILGVMNVKLFKQLRGGSENILGLSISGREETADTISADDATEPGATDAAPIQVEPSPSSAANL